MHVVKLLLQSEWWKHTRNANQRFFLLCKECLQITDLDTMNVISVKNNYELSSEFNISCMHQNGLKTHHTRKWINSNLPPSPWYISSIWKMYFYFRHWLLYETVPGCQQAMFGLSDRHSQQHQFSGGTSNYQIYSIDRQPSDICISQTYKNIPSQPCGYQWMCSDKKSSREVPQARSSAAENQQPAFLALCASSSEETPAQPSQGNGRSQEERAGWKEEASAGF